ncbi:hypothetical protein [Niallia sp.]|uniref:hypothetical protein n=1 Tax=Niallia sp. TaxID=2837523 RepID=UPI00289BE605|nr:hypothetical protein [Niallia sp.]
MEKVELPLEVYNAFEGIKRSWGSLVSEEEINLLLIQIINLASENIGDSITLKKFALEHPTKYIQAIANGYKLNNETRTVMQVDQMINRWLNAEFDGDEKDDRYRFAEQLTSFIKEQLVTQ